MILTVGNTKGGVGKSSLAFNLAISQTLAGRIVWLIDGDRQGTATIAATIRKQAGISPHIHSSKCAEGNVLHDQVIRHQRDFQDVVIDAGGRDSTALRAALIVSNVVLVPFAPRSFDVWALTDMCQLVSEAQVINPALCAYAILSMADNTGRDNQDAIQALKDFPQLTYLSAPILRRKSVANAAGQGLSVLEYKPKDLKAIEELKSLAAVIFSLK